MVSGGGNMWLSVALGFSSPACGRWTLGAGTGLSTTYDSGETSLSEVWLCCCSETDSAADAHIRDDCRRGFNC